MIPDLNRLKVFYYTFHTQSAAKAAGELNITPSAVSQALAKLEDELKVFLFTRLHRRLVPTSAGEQLFEVVAPFIRELENRVQAIQQSRETPSGILRIGSPIEFGKSYFPGRFARFRKTYPDVVFSMKLGLPVHIFPMINEGELDFGLVDIFLTREQMLGDLGKYSIEPMIDEEVIMACSDRYYQQEIKKDHSFKNLVRKEYISYQKSSLTLRNWFKHHFNKFSVDLNRVMTADSHQAVINGIKSHLGLGVVAAHIVKPDIAKGRIVPIRTAKKDVINTIALVQLQDKIPTLTEKTFIRFLKEDIRTSGYFVEYPSPET